jgi:hypothetical protein
MAISYKSRLDVPELVPEELWLPTNRADLFVPHEPEHSDNTMTPREVGHAFFTGSFHLGPEKQILEVYQYEKLPTTELFDNRWGNHIGRAVLRALLDPNRLAAIDMMKVYHNELAVAARFPNPGEEKFFSSFVEFHGAIGK